MSRKGVAENLIDLDNLNRSRGVVGELVIAIGREDVGIDVKELMVVGESDGIVGIGLQAIGRAEDVDIGASDK